ncbi:hypothetical protein [Bacillus sp. USDA818B3_A]|uniref:hypothetical protein n=1 Tax=Bacillus sp. USDA818B3_A TaxID=2698834 RepID=UPI00136AEBB0|nr:hypothetical protein [Bacillus sp. USDA818B3_A]
MDVKYIPADWEKMKAGIGDLIGLGRWGKGMIDTLKDLNDNLEDAEGDIAKYDSDGVISFQHTSQNSKYQGLFEDFEVLHSFTGRVGDIVDRTIDEPFFQDMDAFVEAMRDLTIANYTAKNRIGATDTQFVYTAYGPAQSFTVPKTEVNMDDLFSGDNFFGEQMKLEYDAWKELNSDQNFSQEEYQQAALNNRAFQYEAIGDQQESKEFWVQLGALVVIVGATLICPPAGMALGAAYGAMELSSAVSGKDWVSGRELGTGERWFRGLLAPLDIVPGVSGLSKFSSTVRLAHAGDSIGQIGLKTGGKAGFHQGVTHIDNMITTAGRQSVTRLKNASAVVKDASNVVKNKLAKDTLEAARLVDNAITQAKNITSSRKIGLVMDEIGDVGKVHDHIENTHAVENKLKDVLSKIDGVNLNGSKGGAAVSEEELKLIADAIENGTKNTWDEFLIKNPNLTTSEASEAYIRLVKEQSPWPDGYVPKDSILKEGETFQMALASGQPLTTPGRFSTKDHITSVEFVRNQLAVKSDWKADCSVVVEYRVKAGKELPVQTGPVGPQIDVNADKYLSGGASQIFIKLDRSVNMMDYLEIVSVRTIE